MEAVLLESLREVSVDSLLTGLTSVSSLAT